MKDDIPVPLAELLDPAARRAGVEDGARTGMVWNKWPGIVGPEISRHAEPTSLRGGILRVRADSPAWATELGYLGEEIRRRANEAVGTELITEVRVWTGPGPIRRPRTARADPAPEETTPSGERGRSGRSDDVDPMTAFKNAFAAWRRQRRGPFRGSGPSPVKGRSEAPEDS